MTLAQLHLNQKILRDCYGLEMAIAKSDIIMFTRRRIPSYPSHFRVCPCPDQESSEVLGCDAQLSSPLLGTHWCSVQKGRKVGHDKLITSACWQRSVKGRLRIPYCCWFGSDGFGKNHYPRFARLWEAGHLSPESRVRQKRSSGRI